MWFNLRNSVSAPQRLTRSQDIRTAFYVGQWSFQISLIGVQLFISEVYSKILRILKNKQDINSTPVQTPLSRNMSEKQNTMNLLIHVECLSVHLSFKTKQSLFSWIAFIHIFDLYRRFEHNSPTKHFLDTRLDKKWITIFIHT